MAFELCGADRTVTLSGKTYRVEAPSVGLALQILYCLDRIESKEDEEFLFHTLGKLNWNRFLALHELRIAYKQNRFLFTKGVKALIMQGYKIPVKVIQKLQESDQRPDIPQWRFLLAEYCTVFHVSPAEVWRSTPFPLFLEMSKEIRPLKLRHRLELAYGTGAGFGGVKKKWMDQWERESKATMYDSNGKSDSKPVDYKKNLDHELDYLKRL